jgi:hypothetical protein
MTTGELDMVLAGILPSLARHVASEIAKETAGLSLAVNALAAKLAEIESRPAPKDGLNGKDIDPADVARLIVEAISGMPKPTDGKSVTVEDVRPLVECEIAKAVAGIPAPRDGKDADGVDLKEIVRLVSEDVNEGMENVMMVAVAAEVAKAVAALPAPKDGRSLAPEDVAPMVAELVQRAVQAIPAAKDGVGLTGATIDRDGHLVLMLSDGSMKDAGLVVGRDADQAQVARAVAAAVAAIPKPKDGIDGLGFGDLEVHHDSERAFTLRAVRGDQVKELGTYTVPAQIYRGVWQDGRTYVHQDAVTWGGSQWVCLAPSTTAKPGQADAESRAWTLAVKAGRDGKPGKGEKGDKGDKGEPGKDIVKW